MHEIWPSSCKCISRRKIIISNKQLLVHRVRAYISRTVSRTRLHARARAYVHYTARDGCGALVGVIIAPSNSATMVSLFAAWIRIREHAAMASIVFSVSV